MDELNELLVKLTELFDKLLEIMDRVEYIALKLTIKTTSELVVCTTPKRG